MKPSIRLITVHVSLCVLFTGIPSLLFSQSLVEDTKGESTIILPVGNISFNSTDTKLGVSFYYGVLGPSEILDSEDFNELFKTSLAKTNLNPYKRLFRPWVVGGSISGSQSNGLSNLFSEGNFTPQTEYQLLLGKRFYFSKENTIKKFNDLGKKYGTLISLTQTINNNHRMDSKNNENLISLLSTAKRSLTQKMSTATSVDTIQLKQDTLALGEIIRKFNREFADNRLDMARIKFYKNALIDVDVIDKIYKSYPNEVENLNNNYKNIITENITLVKNVISDEEKRIALYDKVDKIANDLNINLNTSFIIYLAAGGAARQFSLFDNLNSIRYRDTTFYGNHFKIGTNFTLREKKIIVGASIGIQRTNNYDELRSFKHEIVNVVYQDSIRTETRRQTIEGKIGDYSKYSRYPIMIDFVKLWSIQETAIAFNPYTRFYLIDKQAPYKRNHKDIISLGTGIYFFKTTNSTLVTGLVGEFSDWSNVLEGPKEWHKRINVSLVAKINLTPLRLSSIFALE